MDKEAILSASRKENKNRDMVELEVVYLAGSHAARVGAIACCLLSLLSSMIAQIMLYSPWVIYFVMIATQWTVRFLKQKRKSDLILAIMFLALAGLALVGLIHRLLEVGA